jgi:hypothetical protein
MKKSWFLVLGTLTIIGAFYFLTERHQSVFISSIPKNPVFESLKSNTAILQSSETPTPPINKPSKEWLQSLEQMTQKMSGLSDNPTQVDQEITAFAQTLVASQLNELYLLVTEENTSGDKKLLATELLARSQLPISIELLKQIISSSSQQASQIPMVQQEYRAFQMLAIEGLSQKPELKNEARKTLTELASFTSDTLLLDRINRSLWALQGKAPSPEQQDQEALEKVLAH